MTRISLLAWLDDSYPQLRSGFSINRWTTTDSFSGSLIWKVQTQIGLFCLRAWSPEHPCEPQLQFIHNVLQRFADNRLQFIPNPVANRWGQTFTRFKDRLVQLEPWMPGQPCRFDGICSAQMLAAVQAIGQMHAVSFTMLPFTKVEVPLAVSLRFTGLRELTDSNLLDEIERVWRDVSSQHASLVSRDEQILSIARSLAQTARDLAPGLLRRLSEVIQLETRVFPCIRDLRPDHVLLSDKQVSGIIDFGAMQIDTPATDLARFLGGFPGLPKSALQECLDEYAGAFPMTNHERRLVELLLNVNPILSAVNWLKWLYIERRNFTDSQSVASRLRSLLAACESQ